MLGRHNFLTVTIALAGGLVGSTAYAASDVNCTNTINPNTMTLNDCRATGFGLDVCRHLIAKRDDAKIKARYRDLTSILNMVRTRFSEDEVNCVKKRGNDFKRKWIWPAAGCELTNKKSCSKKTGNMCSSQIEKIPDAGLCTAMSD